MTSRLKGGALSEQNRALLEIMPDIKRASRHIELEWPDVVTADDVEQDISIRLLTDGYASGVRDMSPTQRRRFLFRVAQQIASGERVDYEFFTGNFRYSVEEVRGSLDDGALVPDDEGTLSIEHVDVRQAFQSLSEAHRLTLLDRFVFNTFEGHPQNLARAVDALTRELNRAYKRAYEDYKGPGSRKAISNSTAQYVSNSQDNHG